MNNCLFCNTPCKNKFCSLEHYRISVKLGKYDSSFKGKKHSIETIQKFKEMSVGENNPNYGKKHPNLHSEEFKQRQSVNLSKNRKYHKSTKGIKRNYSQTHIENIKLHIQKVNENGFENKGGKCKFYNIDGINIQGRYELFFYLTNQRKPIKTTKRIKTPYGWYTPDFIFEDNFIEIKSTYTLSVSTNSGQLKKIAWVSKNVNKVRIIVLKESEVEEYLSKLDLTNL